MATLSDTRQILTDRVLEIKSLLSSIPSDPSKVVGHPYATQIKGYFFVALYAILEKIITECTKKTLESMKVHSPRKSDIKNIVLSIVLDAEAKAIANCGPDKVWEKRIELFSAIFSSDTVKINESILPIPGGNIKYKHIVMLWEVFEIPVVLTILPPMILKITSVTDHRNAIAHGRQTANDVGRGYSKANLETTLSEYDTLCESIISAFEDYIDNQRYIRGN